MNTIAHAGRIRHVFPLLVATLLALSSGIARAQTNPAPQPLPYTQDFSALPPSSTVYPAGWQGWSIGNAAAAFSTTGPTADQPLVANGTAASVAGNAYNYNGKIGYLNTSAPGGDRTVALAIDGSLRFGIVVQYDIMTIRNQQDATNTRINEVTLQYRVGTSGPWASLTGIEYQNLGGIPNNQTGAVTTPQNLQNRVINLPPACDNQPVVQLRWASRQVSGAGGRPSFAVDNLFVTGSTPPTHVITASADPGLTITPSGAVTVIDGASQAFSIAPSDGCHGIVDVIVDGFSVGPVTSYTFDTVTVDHSIHAVGFIVGSFTLESSASPGGSISPNGSTVVPCGASQGYVMTPDPCFAVVDVIVDGLSVGAVSSYTFTAVNANHSITANFGPAPPLLVMASAGAGGHIFPNGGVTVPCGGNRGFIIGPDPCHVTADVLVDGISVGAVSNYLFVNVQANHTIAASFALTTYTIVASSGPNGSISPSGNVSVNCGADQTFDFTPEPGFVIKDIVVDGNVLAPAASYTFNSVSANHTIVVENKVPLVAPPYEPDTWNNGAGDPPDPDNEQGDNNCYNYATNKKTDTFAQPGTASGNPPATFDCTGISAAAVADGLTASTKDAVCDNGYKVALVFGDIQDGEDVIQDYHWYRQGDDGKWSHKPGQTEATNKDNAGNEITDPETCDKGKLNDGTTNQYANFCGYFCVTKATVVELVADGGSMPPGAGKRLADLLGVGASTNGSPSRPVIATTTEQAAVTPLSRSGRRDTTVTLTTAADLDSIADMLSGLPTEPDPGWPSRLGYRGMSVRVEATSVAGAQRVRVWRGVIRVDQGHNRHHYRDTKHFERWLHRRCYGFTRLDVPGGERSIAIGLSPARPNPFASTTSIPFALASPAKVGLRIYDLSGRTVRVLVDMELSAGTHQVLWDGRDGSGAAVRSGAYFYKLTVDGRPAGSAKTVFLGH